jgi:hypothetical protein
MGKYESVVIFALIKNANMAQFGYHENKYVQNMDTVKLNVDYVSLQTSNTHFKIQNMAQIRRLASTA